MRHAEHIDGKNSSDGVFGDDICGEEPCSGDPCDDDLAGGLCGDDPRPSYGQNIFSDERGFDTLTCARATWKRTTSTRPTAEPGRV